MGNVHKVGIQHSDGTMDYPNKPLTNYFNKKRCNRCTHVWNGSNEAMKALIVATIAPVMTQFASIKNPLFYICTNVWSGSNEAMKAPIVATIAPVMTQFASIKYLLLYICPNNHCTPCNGPF